MFTVRAGYTDKVEVKTSIEKVREFFLDIRNFADLMPGIASIHTDAKGIAHWKIQAEIPLVGQMIQKFAVELCENTEERIEWFPISVETQNFLRYSPRHATLRSSNSHRWLSLDEDPPASCTSLPGLPARALSARNSQKKSRK